MNRGEAGINSFVVGRISRVANADQIAFSRKEAAAAAAVDRLARGGVVRFAPIFVNGGDLRGPDAWIGTLVAAEGECTVTGSDGEAGRGDVDGANAGSANADEGD